jgi:glycosyltransferase involved in cell wall biosynthesis
VRRQAAALPRGDGPVVNVAALDKGWFFEDLKRHFAHAGRPGVRVAVSERPRRDADAWIVIRTHEAAASPDPARTLVQIHDMFDAGLYKPDGKRASVRRCGAVSFTHPGQRAILEASGVSLAGKAVLDRPIGALEAFDLRSNAPERFTVGWFGRPVRHLGKDLKRVDCVVQAIRRLGDDVRVVLVGERLEAQHRKLAAAGVECVYHRRAKNPIDRYPDHYKGLDCLAVYSTSEAGPLCLFEALASGVPVVSSRVGWAPRLLADSDNGFLVDSVPEMVEAFERIRAERHDWFARRASIRESLGGYTLESWVAANLDLALDLAQARAA